MEPYFAYIRGLEGALNGMNFLTSSRFAESWHCWYQPWPTRGRGTLRSYED
jgi:hypothetical protein